MARNCLFRSKYCPLWCVMTCYFCVNEGLISLLCELSKHFCQRCAIVINAHASDMFSLVDHAENSSSNLHYFPELLKYIKNGTVRHDHFLDESLSLTHSGPLFMIGACLFYLQYADLNRSIDALNAWKNATMLKPDHSLAWNNMVILLDNTGKVWAESDLLKS